MTKNELRLTLVIIAVLALFAACAKDEATPLPLTSPFDSPQSPVTTPAAPAEPGSKSVELPPFTIDEPLYEGDTVVSGSGPADAPIIIMDVALATAIGEGRIGADGKFSIAVNPPLKAPNLVGIMFDETESSPYTVDQLPCGERCRDQPMVGLVLYRAPVSRP
jgi:hypothetical protein